MCNVYTSLSAISCQFLWTYVQMTRISLSHPRLFESLHWWCICTKATKLETPGTGLEGQFGTQLFHHNKTWWPRCWALWLRKVIIYHTEIKNGFIICGRFINPPTINQTSRQELFGFSRFVTGRNREKLISSISLVHTINMIFFLLPGNASCSPDIASFFFFHKTFSVSLSAAVSGFNMWRFSVYASAWRSWLSQRSVSPGSWPEETEQTLLLSKMGWSRFYLCIIHE